MNTNSKSNTTTAPTLPQIQATLLVTEWYLTHYFRTADDVGVPQMFSDPERLGFFAVSANAIATGDDHALFRLFVTMIMFQRRSDQQIMRVLKGIPRQEAEELTDQARLSQLSAESGCPNSLDLESLLVRCDLSKSPDTKVGCCASHPNLHCHLKRHTEILKRYGHFGKVPTSASLLLKKHGEGRMNALRDKVWSQTKCPTERARRLI